MISRELRNYERLTRVRDFGLTHAAAFAANSRGAQLFAEINIAVQELTAQAATQTASRSTDREGTISKAGAYAALHQHLAMINRTARAIAIEQPGVGEKFRMPAGSGDQALLNAARAFLANATPLQQEFVANEMPADFLTTLAAEIAELEEAISDKHQNRDTHVTATAAKDAAFERGLNALRKLDAVVRNKFQNDPVMLAAWESASHAPRLPRKPPIESPPASPANP